MADNDSSTEQADVHHGEVITPEIVGGPTTDGPNGADQRSAQQGDEGAARPVGQSGPHVDGAEAGGAEAGGATVDGATVDGAIVDGAEVDGAEVDGAEVDDIEGEAITRPAKVMRIGSMIKQLLEEVRSAELDEASRERLAEVFERSVTELSEAMSPDLQEELRSLTLPFDHDEVPSEAELRVAKAQLVGWLEGLFHGIQATMMAQQAAAQAQAQAQGRSVRQLPNGQVVPADGGAPVERPGTYL